VTTQHEFSGIFVAHWEVARFCVVSGRRLFGLLPRVEKYEPHFPPCALDNVGINVSRQGPQRHFRMRVLGYLGPRGTFGHHGICSHQLFVSEIVESVETSDPGPTW